MKLPVTRRKFLSFIGLGAVAPAFLAQSKPDVSALWFSVDMARRDNSMVIIQSRMHPDDALGTSRIPGDCNHKSAILGKRYDYIILDDPWEYQGMTQ